MNYITTKDAAIICGVTLRTMQNYCKMLGTDKIGGHYLLTPGQVKEIEKHVDDHPRGRRKKNIKVLDKQ